MPAKKKAPVSEDKKKGKKRSGGRPPHDDDDSVDSYGNLRDFIAYSDEEEEYMSDDDSSSSDGSYRPPKRAAAKKAEKKIRKFLPRKKRGNDDDEESMPRKKREAVVEEDEETMSSESESDETPDMEEEEEETENSSDTANVISFLFGGAEGPDRATPKRHNMKKETEEVKRFVKLVTEPYEEVTIDDQIDHFKGLAADRRKHILEVLERRPDKNLTNNMMFKILDMNLPADTQNAILAKYNTLQMMDPASGEYFKLRNWLEKVTSLPLGLYKDMPVRLDDGPEKCGEFMTRAKRCLDEAVYGQDEAKMQILQFIAGKISNRDSRGLSLLLVGPPGIGKTCLIKNGIAKALDWPFQFISLGGDSDASTYTGHQLVYEGSHCGKIANSLIASKSMSMVLMWDELDKISGTTKGEEVQNILVHLTDPSQNDLFEDKYLANIHIDLSKVMFVFSANDINKIDRILLDRMMVIQLKGYTKAEKLSIAENFLLPAALKEVNLVEKVAISREVIEHILTNYASEETGVRELKRCLEQIAQKINMLRMYNTKDLAFHIPNFTLPFILTKDHVDKLLKKKESEKDVSHLAMYI